MAEKPKSAHVAEAPPAPDQTTAETPEERLHPILTNEEVAAVRKKAAAKLDKERRAKAEAELQAAIEKELRAETGELKPDEDIVSITIVLPEFSDRILVDGKSYWHGQIYQVPRAMANSFRETIFRGEVHDNEVHGRTQTSFYNRRRDTVMNAVSGAIVNAPRAH